MNGLAPGTTSQRPVAVASPPFDPRLAHLLARACAAAYLATSAEVTTACAAEESKLFTSGGTLGFAARLGDDLLVAFRGTVSPHDEWNSALVHWLINLNYAQCEAPGGRVHQGFCRALDPVWGPLLDQLKGWWGTGRRLWVTGHSQGGALAILAGARLASEGLQPVAVYTFGAPRVGDAAFIAAYPAAVHRVENGNDVVCHLPLPPAARAALRPWLGGRGGLWRVPADVQYEDVGRLTFIDWDGKVHAEVAPERMKALAAARLARHVRTVLTSGERQSLLADHAITAYVSRLDCRPADGDRPAEG